MRSMPCSAPAEAVEKSVYNDTLLIDELDLEESKDEEDLTEEEQTMFGRLYKLFPTRLLRAYW